MAALFDQVCVPAAGRATVGAWYQKWRVMAIAGTILDVQDTQVNAARFGYYNQGGAKQSAFPQVRIVSLVECGTHASVAAEFDGVKTSERVLTDRLAGAFTDDMIVLADRGFYSYQLFKTAAANGAQLLWRISNTLQLPVLEIRHDGSFRSELLPSKTKTAIKGGRTPKDAAAQRMLLRPGVVKGAGQPPFQQRPDHVDARQVSTGRDRRSAPITELSQNHLPCKSHFPGPCLSTAATDDFGGQIRAQRCAEARPSVGGSRGRQRAKARGH